MRLPALIRRLRSQSAHRVIATVSLVAYLVAACGIPLPTVVGNVAGDKAFPCQGHSCGCHSADQCWKSCCCNSPQERIAWARANRVEPPRSLIALVDQARPKSCCQSAKVATKPVAGHRSCCSPNVKEVEQKAATEIAKSKPARAAPVYGFMALKCRGASTQWITSGAVTPPPAAIQWQSLAACCGWLHLQSDAQSLLFETPPTPPPRVS